ncbi:hypothetical protein K502DRAFT_300448 [Neoconidiobolus thromboides FSU 785]|nr:hypothetical protein K502DRAFT_300448 [Neoconidiobolus thromboides FSU 785]
MAIAPIRGKLARSIRNDIVGSISLGLVFGYFYWNNYHLPTQNKISEFYVKLDQQKAEKKEA